MTDQNLAPSTSSDLPLGIVGFLGPVHSSSLLCRLFAAGHETIDQKEYDWDGQKRGDGPLFLFQYTLRGQGSLEVGPAAWRLTAGDLFMVEIPGIHRYQWPPGADAWEFIFILVRQQNLRPFWEELQAIHGPVVSLPTGSLVEELLTKLVRQALAHQIDNLFVASGEIYRFFMEVLALGRADSAMLSDAPQSSGINRILMVMTRDFRAVLSLDAMAKIAGLSKFHFLREFRRQTGQTPGDYLTRLRLKHAIQLLQESHQGLAAIARDCGYANASYFIKAFKRHTGFTPGEFRSGTVSPRLSQVQFITEQ